MTGWDWMLLIVSIYGTLFLAFIFTILIFRLVDLAWYGSRELVRRFVQRDCVDHDVDSFPAWEE